MTGKKEEAGSPHYDLLKVREAFKRGDYRIGTFDGGTRIWNHLAKRGWDEDDVVEVICNLQYTDFHKSQKHESIPDIWLDIYKPAYLGERLYVKFHLAANGMIYLVRSFCGDHEEH
ncbi:MAG: type II toxin-antitoxin system MqsR family toxin [Coriobacteriia bacterium]